MSLGAGAQEREAAGADPIQGAQAGGCFRDDVPRVHGSFLVSRFTRHGPEAEHGLLFGLGAMGKH